MEHMADPYVREAQRLDLRSRAAFKLKEINMRYNIIKKDNLVVDLGASPGGWTQACLEIIGTDLEKKNIQVYAMDLLQMDYVTSFEPASRQQIFAGGHYRRRRHHKAATAYADAPS